MAHYILFAPLALVMVLSIFFGRTARAVSLWAAGLLCAAQTIAAVWAPASVWLGGPSALLSAFPFALSADPLARIMLAAIGIAAMAALSTAGSALKPGLARFDLSALVLLAVAGMNGLVMARDVFTMYVFIEVTAVCSFIMIAMDKNRDALEGSFKYIVLSATATVMMLTAIALMSMFAGGTTFTELSAAAGQARQHILMLLAVGIFLAGLFIKSGLMPFHGWLPDAYTSAPAPVSVFLAGIVTKATGIFTLARLLLEVFGFEPSIRSSLLFVGSVSVLGGALAALPQKDFKRMLAYSSISQMGYMALGLGAGSPLGIAGAMFHLLNHTVFKAQLFINAAAVERQTGTRDMDALGGLSERMPVTGATSVIGLLSAAGIPPLAGFWSKLIIVLALWFSGNQVFAVIGILAGVISLAYLLSMQRRVFFGPLAPACAAVTEAAAGYTIPAALLAALSIAMGVFFPYVLDRLILPLWAFCG